MKDLCRKNARMNCEIQSYKMVMCARALIEFVCSLPERFYT